MFLQCCCYLFIVFVSVCIICSDVVPLGVMIGMSSKSWCHKSNLSPIPGFEDQAYQSCSLLFSFRLRFLCFMLNFLLHLFILIILFYYFI